MSIRDDIQEHRPSRVWYEILVKYAKKSSFLEALDIGVGVSTFALLDAGLGNIVAVDIKNKKEVKRWVNKHGHSDRFIFIQTSSDNFFSNNDKKFDIISIDGDHEYEQVKKDLENSWKMCNEGGYIVCDDYGHKGITGVKKAVDEFCKNNNIQKILENGKAILKKQ